MRIAIVGTGHVGAALARGLSGKGHAVTLGARNPGSDAASALAAETGSAVTSPSAAAASADLVILALPWAAVDAVLEDLGGLDGKIVVDCTNPLGMVDGALGLAVGHTSSGGEMVQRRLPQARVVKTLNQVGAEVMARNAHFARRPAMLMAGDDPAAKATVAELLRDLGFDPLDAGDITKSRLLEPFALVWINQALARGKGRDWAFAIV
ncbi:NAD(P)-binding domain-containing protein [Roseibacterium sp. SDUM158016]|uniref:NADPH-dependent F420 reductase n=1 Tax=Roseicyclus sediminis TaxID=2980997 RepID=UPI0021CE061B|nr:NAD(P)-binding domain-containing protein [Roseibacterium sp. SDUM158016]MCU4652733.1 NAD(P)-binding domain-containing protein [Roseibacterium sp. SDUM158016]